MNIGDNAVGFLEACGFIRLNMDVVKTPYLCHNGSTNLLLRYEEVSMTPSSEIKIAGQKAFLIQTEFGKGIERIIYNS